MRGNVLLAAAIKLCSLLCIAWCIVLFSGCSGGGLTAVELEQGTGGMDVPQNGKHHAQNVKQHMLWGLWNIRVDAGAGNADGSEWEIVPLRHTEVHLNALNFLEPPANTLLTIEGAWMNGNTLNVNIGLRHPYPGQTHLTGFDVKGIVILPGSDDCFTCDDIVTPADDETRLIIPTVSPSGGIRGNSRRTERRRSSATRTACSERPTPRRCSSRS